VKKILALSLILTGCSAVQTTIDSGKNIAGAIVDDVISVGETAISIPVGAVGTVVDKLEEETTKKEPTKESN
tara:strand:+ start:192 stop:407 length:216 start_codon:yes stop_codon:yes gene_type:complete